MSATSITEAFGVPASPFAGVEVCRMAGFQLPPGTSSPVFDQDTWDFTAVVGLLLRDTLHEDAAALTAVTVPV